MSSNDRFPRRILAQLLLSGGAACCMAWMGVLVGMVLASGCGHMREGSAARAIPWDSRLQRSVSSALGGPHAPEPLAKPAVVDHPFMAPHGASSMHVDSFTTNAYPYAGPIGRAPEVSSRSMGFLGGECPTINFDRQG